MASLHNSAVVSHSVGVLRPSAGVHAPPLFSVSPRRHLDYKTHLHLRLKGDVRIVAKKRWSGVFASSCNTKGGASDGSNAKSHVSDNNSRPSLLNILAGAGLVVFLFAGWAMLYVSTWLIFG